MRCADGDSSIIYSHDQPHPTERRDSYNAACNGNLLSIRIILKYGRRHGIRAKTGTHGCWTVQRKEGNASVHIGAPRVHTTNYINLLWSRETHNSLSYELRPTPTVGWSSHPAGLIVQNIRPIHPYESKSFWGTLGPVMCSFKIFHS